MLKLVVITGVRHGAHGEILRALAEAGEIEIRTLVLSDNVTGNRAKAFRRKARKLRRIGLFGGLVGLYLRTWNDGLPVQDICEVAERAGVPVARTPRYNGKRTRELFRQADADLGIALGTGILRPSVFEIPRWGMVNVHGDVLPRFRGGMSIIWPIYEGVAEAGFTIHQIDRGIDTGDILHTERFPIRFEKTLKDTYRTNVLEIQRRVPTVLTRVLSHYRELSGKATSQSGGTVYTTPKLSQYLRMRRQHRRLRLGCR